MPKQSELDARAKKHAQAVKALGGVATAAEVAKYLRAEHDPTFRALEGAVKRRLLLREYGPIGKGRRQFRFRVRENVPRGT